LTNSDPFVTVEKNKITVICDGEMLFEEQYDDIKDIKFLRDTKTIEGFMNGGEASFSILCGSVGYGPFCAFSRKLMQRSSVFSGTARRCRCR
jgi:hypothetical protein